MKVSYLLVVGLLALSIATCAPASEALIGKALKPADALKGLCLDKCGTTALIPRSSVSQAAAETALANTVSFSAEGTGFEPATGFPASDFESDR